MGDEASASVHFETRQDRQLDTTARLVGPATRLRWEPEQVDEPLNDFLIAWEEPRQPLHPVYNPANYSDYKDGHFPTEAFASVPIIVALGGLNRRSRVVSSERFGGFINVFHDNLDVYRIIDDSRMYETVTATRRALKVIEGLGQTSFLNTCEEARFAIIDSGFFSKRDLRSILSPS